MTKHVHEWAIHITGKVHCEECGVVLKPTKADAMLNATERLSAEDALIIANAIDKLAYSTDGKDGGKSTKALRAYADKLEGKDA